MWTIEKPQIGALEAFNTCIAGITVNDLKQRLQSVRDNIQQAEGEFDQAGEAATLHLIPSAADVGGTVTAKEMERLYDRHMARARSRGRTIYDRLMIAASNDQCPFCGHRTVSTLDHSLPKAQHPALAVTPINLIPCCKDCNHNKGNLELTCAEDQLLNAYYDDVADGRWLFAAIVEGSPPGARFFVETPDEWVPEVSARVQNHFEKLQLAKLYASQAGRQLQNARGALGEIYDAAGMEAVRDDVARRSRGCSQVSLVEFPLSLLNIITNAL